MSQDYITNDDGELWEQKKPKKKFKSNDGELWESEEEFDDTIQKLEEQAPDYGVGK